MNMREFCQIVRNGNYGKYYALYDNGRVYVFAHSYEYVHDDDKLPIVKLQSFGKELQLKDYMKMARNMNIREFCKLVRNDGNYGNYYALYEDGRIDEFTNSDEYVPGRRPIVKLQSFGKELRLKDYMRRAKERMYPYY